MAMRIFKKYFITGLLIWVPLVVTVWVLGVLIATLEGFVPGFLSAESLFGVDIPGFRFVLVIVVVLLTGVFAANFLGRTLVGQWENLLGRIPLVRSIYNSVKQVSDTVLAPNGQAFRQAVLVQYPRHGSWTIAFLTGTPSGEVATYLQGEHVSVYVPTTPNPTSGFFLMMPRSDVVELDMSVDAALKYVVSMGVVGPVPASSVPVNVPGAAVPTGAAPVAPAPGGGGVVAPAPAAPVQAASVQAMPVEPVSASALAANAPATSSAAVPAVAASAATAPPAAAARPADIPTAPGVHRPGAKE
jgi:uncharacterized membrane protein